MRRLEKVVRIVEHARQIAHSAILDLKVFKGAKRAVPHLWLPKFWLGRRFELYTFGRLLAFCTLEVHLAQIARNTFAHKRTLWSLC